MIRSPNDTRLLMVFIECGIPVLIFKADPVDARKWNAQSMTELVEDFIENRIVNKAGEQK